MQTEIIIAGSGGQGVLFAGTLLAQSAIEENKNTTWFPSYGAEIRGGTTNSIVVISNEDIGSPIILHPDILIALNEKSYKKFAPRMKPGTLVIINSSLIKEKQENTGVKTISIPVSEIADKELGDLRTANLVALGACLKESKILKLESAQKSCERLFKEKSKIIPINKKALETGYNLI